MKRFAAVLLIAIALAACSDEEESVDGRWESKITREQRDALRIENAMENDRFVVVFQPDTMLLNGTPIDVEYLSNKGRTLVKLRHENRVITLHHDDRDPNRLRMTAVSYLGNKAFNFELRKSGE